MDQFIINMENTWVSEVNKELDNWEESLQKVSKHRRKHSIYKVPSNVTELCKQAYKPQTVSIGPYHHDEEVLKGMEENKHRALLHFLKRSRKPLESYVRALAPMVEDLMDAYDQLDDYWMTHKNEFLKLMIIDGCFILELVRTAYDGDKYKAIKERYEKDDPVFSKHGKFCFLPYLRRDLLMLENQVPMQLLTTLLQHEGQYPQPNEMNELIVKFFFPEDKDAHVPSNSLHILDACRKSLVNEERDKELRKNHKPTPKKIKATEYNVTTAVELSEAGVKIGHSRTSSLQDISFDRSKGELKLPFMIVDDMVESQYLNMLAFERFHADAGNEVTSYVYFMDTIIDSAQDVSLLRSCRVMQNALGSDEAVANLFNSLSRDIAPDPESRLEDVLNQVAYYAGKPSHRWIAYTKRNYFTNPLITASLAAAVVLFLLAFLQTLYAVLGHYKKD